MSLGRAFTLLGIAAQPRRAQSELHRDGVYDDGQRLPASYANFYIANTSVIVPTYRSKNDDKALDILQQCFPGRHVIGIDSTDIIWGLGSFHCLSQQEPAI